jgi:hypothetical protein
LKLFGDGHDDAERRAEKKNSLNARIQQKSFLFLPFGTIEGSFLNFFKLLFIVMPKGREREVVESRNPTEEFSFFAFRKEQGVIA